jgi:hypothetical protein
METGLWDTVKAFESIGWEARVIGRHRLQEIKEFNPDLVFFEKVLKPAEVEFLNSFSNTWFNCTDPLEAHQNRRGGQGARNIFECARASTVVSNLASLEAAKEIGKEIDRTVHMFVCPVDTDVLHSDRMPQSTHDACFMGTRSGYRMAYIEMMRKAGLKVATFGGGFEETKDFRQDEFADGLVGILNLNLSIRHWIPMVVGSRLPRVMACGGFVLSERGDLWPYEEGVHYAGFDGLNDIVQVAKYWLVNKKGREAIAKEAMQFTRERFNLATSAQWMVDIWSQY